LLIELDNNQDIKINAAVKFARQILSTDDLNRLYWLSGSTCAGKTTISTSVATRLQWNVYHCDNWETQHRERADAQRHPSWAKYSKLTGDPLWLQPVEQHLELENLAASEQFELIAEDLATALKQDPRPLIYDGFVSPKILVSLIPTKTHAYYLVSSEQFQRHHYQQRPWIHDVLSRTSDPSRAWNNWMTRDIAGARSLESVLQQMDLPWMTVDGSENVAQTVNRVCNSFLSEAAV
jgi:hypothetical protein